ncbi:MAG: hypothetical protein J1E37_03840 [Prevotella sp.]|nr:hypothetical protein [Prevotella sp.]
MRKFLLFAVAAIFAGSVSAQRISKRPAATPNKSAKSVVAQQRTQLPLQISKVLPEMRHLKPSMMNGKKVVKVENKYTKNVTRRAGNFAAAYNGTCGSDDGPQKWVMTPTAVQDNSGNEYAAFEDLVPNDLNTNTYLLYSMNSTLITVPAQYVGTLTFVGGERLELWFTNFTSNSVDGSVNLTLADDGGLTMDAPFVAWVLMPEGTETFSFDAIESLWWSLNNIKYQDASIESAPDVSYTSDDAIFYSGITTDASIFTYQHVMWPAYAPVSFTNLTTDNAETWSWEQYTIGFNGEKFYNDQLVASADTRDFIFNTVGGELYAAPILKGSYKGMESDPYQGFDDEYGIGLAYAGAIGDSWVFEDGSAPIISRANIKNGLSGIVSAGTTSNYSGLVFFQGKPVVPLYFEGVNMFVYNFAKVAETVNLKCKIYKVNRSSGSPALGELVAESDLDQSSLSTSNWNSTAQLKWNNFKSTDETGTIFNIDYFFVDYEFAIVVEGWNNGTFTGMAIGDGGEDNSTTTSTAVIRADNGRVSTLAYYGHAFVGFDGLSYGYLHTENDTNIALPATGGQASITVEPMICNSDYSTRLYFESAITDTDADEDYDDDGWPVWLSVRIANESYTEDGYHFDLVFSADALPAGVEERSATVVFFQEGAQLTVTVTQGASTGISAVTTSVKTTGSAMYNLAGQRVDNSFKGLVIKDGKKVMMK